VSLSPGDEVPQMFTRKPRLQLEKFAINGAKRLLQHNLPIGDIFILPERASPLAQAFLLVAEQRRQEIAQDHARSGLDQSIFLEAFPIWARSSEMRAL
jgi:hypothetical protein